VTDCVMGRAERWMALGPTVSQPLRSLVPRSDDLSAVLLEQAIMLTGFMSLDARSPNMCLYRVVPSRDVFNIS
jgi:hypothetical protein